MLCLLRPNEDPSVVYPSFARSATDVPEALVGDVCVDGIHPAAPWALHILSQVKMITGGAERADHKEEEERIKKQKERGYRP
jgi:hypothetical protein